MQDEIKTIKNWLGSGSINIFGMPFAGKDTQGETIADLLSAELLGGGKILRNSIIPPHVKEIMEAGGLIPTDDYLRIVLPYLSQEKFQNKPLVLSSLGRWHGEEEGVMQATEASAHPIKAVILLTVPESVARDRHKLASHEGDRGSRADDAEHVFDTRIAEYQDKTLPVIDFYRQKGLLHEIDGTPTPVEVTDAILTCLTKAAATKA